MTLPLALIRRRRQSSCSCRTKNKENVVCVCVCVCVDLTYLLWTDRSCSVMNCCRAASSGPVIDIYAFLFQEGFLYLNTYIGMSLLLSTCQTPIRQFPLSRRGQKKENKRKKTKANAKSKNKCKNICKNETRKKKTNKKNNNNNKNVEKRKYFILFNHSISVIAPRRNAQTSRAPDQPAHINAVFPEILNGCFIFAHLNECQNKVLDNNTSGISLQGVGLALQ